MRDTKRRETRWALSVASFLPLQAALAPMSAGSAEALSLPTGQILVQATPAPAATGQATQSLGATTAQPPHAPIEEVEARITDLRRRLLITPAQEPEFKAYADVMRANAQTIQALFQERAKETDTSAVTRLRWVARLTQAHADNLNKLVPVFEALYQSLSDQQKKAADTVFEEIRQRRAARRAH
jgi:periplasmic protein CpxP/Spy